MSYDISGFGVEARIMASVTFPAGFSVTEFADDADPFDFGVLQIADSAMSLNGDLVTWSTANPIPLTINVIAGSDDDRNLAVLLEANRVGQGKTSARDEVTAVLTFPGPDGRSVTLTNGRAIDGMVANGVASAGRFKTKPYNFVFENKSDN